MTSIPIMVVSDFSQKFVVEIDASDSGIGAVLMQGGRPISYLNKALSFRNRSKFVYKRELMAIVLEFQKWQHYLLGRRFKVRTDQRSLKFLTE